jgi:hypothetical protein
MEKQKLAQFHLFNCLPPIIGSIVLFYSLIRALENMLYKLSNKGEKKLLVCIYRYVCTGRKAKNK